MAVKKLTDINKNSNVEDVLDTQIDYAKKGVYHEVTATNAPDSSLVLTEKGRKMNSVNGSSLDTVWYLKDEISITNNNLKELISAIVQSGGSNINQLTIANNKGGAGVVTDEGLVRTLDQLLNVKIDAPINNKNVHDLPLNTDYQGSIKLLGFEIKFGTVVKNPDGNNWGQVNYRDPFTTRCIAGPFITEFSNSARTMAGVKLATVQSMGAVGGFEFLVTNSISTAYGARAAFTWFAIGV